MKKMIKNGLLVSSLLVSSSLSCYAGTNLDFAMKLAKDGYPELAKKYLDKDNIKADPNKEGRNKVLGEIELQLARSSPDLKTRKEHIKNAVGYFKGTKQTALEAAAFSFSMANQIKMGLKEPGLSAAEKASIASEVIPYFEEAKTQYKAYLDANKETFEKFMERLMGEEKPPFQTTKEGKAGIESIYSPYVIAEMRYFECIVEKANLLPKGDASRCTGLDKVVDEADAFGYLVEAPVPTATIAVYVARIHGIMAECGVDAKGSLEKANEKFKEVLAFEKPSNSGDARIIRDIKAQAIEGMMEMALRNSDYNSALEALEIYTSGKPEVIMPSNYKFNLDDFEILLNGILINANAYKNAKDAKDNDKYQRNIDKIKLHLEKAIPSSNSPGFWKKKFNLYLTEAMSIMGKIIEDPLIIIQLADQKKSENKFDEAIPMYEKALAGKIVGTDRMTKKPAAYNSLAICAFNAEKFAIGAKALKDFFAEFPPTDARNKGLLDQYKIAAKNYFKLASRVYAESKLDTDKEMVMKSLDILEMFIPEGVVFTKVDALSSTGNYIDTIKLLETVKKDSVDYDKALYLKGVNQYNYSGVTKTKNNQTHNELSLKLAEDSKKTFEELIDYINTDKTDIIQEKKEKRVIWVREAKKSIAFLLMSLEDFKKALPALIVLNDEYKKTPEDKKHPNRLSVLRNIIIANNSIYGAEKENNVKQEMLPKIESFYTEIKELDISAFELKDKSKTAEENKKKILIDIGKRVGMMLIMNPLKDPKLITRGIELLNEGGKENKIENMDLFLARKFLELNEFESAIICFKKVLKEYEDKGWSSPLKPEDFKPVSDKLITDESRNFFRVNFENHAFPPKNTEGKEIGKNTRDYGRLKKNLEYVLADGEVNKKEDAAEKALREKIQITTKKEPWTALKATGELTRLQKKLNDFLTYLGIVDDLALSNKRSMHFEDAIKYSEIMRANYPGILLEDKKHADLMFDYAKFLMKDKANDEKALAVLNDTMKMYLDIKTKLNYDPSTKLWLEINEKRLINSAMIYKVSQKKDVLDQIHSALNILSSNQEVYVEYTNLFAVLEEMGQLPAELKPKTPEEIRAINEKNLEKDRIENEKLIEEKKQQELNDLKKRNLGAVGADCSFFPIEMRDLDSAKFDLFKSYYEKIQGAVPLKANADEKDLLDAFNLVLRNPLMHKSLPAEFNRTEPVVAGFIKSMDEYIQINGAKKAEGTTQTISLNRKIIELCFSQLPKILPIVDK